MKPDLDAVWKYCRFLNRAERYDETDGYAYWLLDFTGRPFIPEAGADMDIIESKSTKEECGKCTNGADLIAKHFGGYVAGYPMGEEYKQSLVGYDCGGHDFAVLGNYIVDWWGLNYEASLTYPILRYDKAIQMGKFLPREYWTVFPSRDHRIDPCRPAVLKIPRNEAQPRCHGNLMPYGDQRWVEGNCVQRFTCPTCFKKYDR